MQHCDGLALFDFSHGLVESLRGVWDIMAGNLIRTQQFSWNPPSLRHDDFYLFLVLKNCRMWGPETPLYLFLEGC